MRYLIAICLIAVFPARAFADPPTTRPTPFEQALMSQTQQLQSEIQQLQNEIDQMNQPVVESYQPSQPVDAYAGDNGGYDTGVSSFGGYQNNIQLGAPLQGYQRCFSARGFHLRNRSSVARGGSIVRSVPMGPMVGRQISRPPVVTPRIRK